MDRLSASLSLGMLVACGGGTSPPTAPATSGPAPAPVTYDGTYTGTAMTWRDPQGQMTVTASTTVTQTGSKLFFTSLVVAAPIRGRRDYRMGPAILKGNTFDNTLEYATAGCGQATNHYRGSFSADGNVMDMTMTLISSGCAHVEVRGEMRRDRP